MWFWFWKFWHHLGEGFLSLVSLRSHTHWLAICSSRHFLNPFHLTSQFLCFNPYKKIHINSNWTFSMYKRSLVPLTVILGYMSGEGHCSFLLGFETKRTAVLKLKKKKKLLAQAYICHLSNNMVDFLTLPLSQHSSTLCIEGLTFQWIFTSLTLFFPHNSVVPEL